MLSSEDVADCCNIRTSHVFGYIKRLLAGLSPRKTGFDPSPRKIWVDKVAVGQGFLRELRSVSSHTYFISFTHTSQTLYFLSNSQIQANFALEQAMAALRGSTGTALLFL